MLAGIEIVCFAASYAVSLVLEISRLFFRSGIRGAIMVGFAGAGLAAHSLFLASRAYEAVDADQTPLSSAFDWYLLAAWVLAATYLYLAFYHPRTAIGLFVLPLVLGLVLIAALWADLQPFPVDRASQWWGAVHGLLLLLGTVAVMIGFAAGMMYLVHAFRLKRKRPPLRGLQLPSLEWLDRVNSRAIVISVLMLCAGHLAGVILNLVNQGRAVDELPWSDPVVVSSAATVVWLLLAACFSLLYKPARQGRKVAYLTVASFVFLVFSLASGLVLPTEHRASAAPEAGASP